MQLSGQLIFLSFHHTISLDRVRETSQMTPTTSPQIIQEILERLRQMHPDAHCELNYESPHQLLVATILSAQSTDVRVNQVTPELFAKYPTVADFAGADPEELQAIIRPVGFFRQKCTFIQESSQRILHQFGGDVPNKMEDLITLKGVARKTANVVLGEIFQISEGITVDTHVKRIAKRLGWTEQTDPVKVERELMALIPKEDWIDVSHLLVFHGRRICFARSPNCTDCLLNTLCPSAE